MKDNEWLRKVRIAMIDHNNMTQAELAKRINVSPTIISDLFKYGKGSKKTIERINGCLGVR